MTTMPGNVDRDLQARVEAALRSIEDPCSESLKAGWSVFDLGLLVSTELTADAGLVVELTLTDPMCPFFELLEERVGAAVSRATGHECVSVHVSSQVAWEPGRLKRGPLDGNEREGGGAGRGPTRHSR